MNFQSLIQGHADSVALDPVRGRVKIAGRDLTAAFMESKTQDAFANQTSSDIAAILADRHGLATSITPTTTPVGRYYQNEHDRITLNQFSRAITEWDLLVFLARQEGFDLFVQGTTLFFQPPSDQLVPAFVVQPSELTDLQLRRSLTLARDIQVTVKSWNSRQQTAFTQTASAQGPRGSNGSGLPPGKPQRYILVRPNLTPDQALQLAQRVLTELTQHERVVDLGMPGELTLTPRDQLLLTGTNTDFDQVYYVDSIERSLDHAGFRQRVRARNTSPRSDATVPADTTMQAS